MNEGYSLSDLENRIGYIFKDKALIKQALTHSSFANEQKILKNGDYERLEFLGDSVLEMVSSEFLYKTYPDRPEGELTKLRASMVCEVALAYCARDIDLGKYLLLGKGEERTGGRNRDSIIADVMESIVGAIFIDGGIEPAKAHIDKYILSDLDNKRLFYDSKSTLQEIVQGISKKEPQYNLLKEEGPEHEKIFTVEVLAGDDVLAKGEGKTKKGAEQQAAYNALMLLKDKGYVFKKY